jgi:hypothetical protein
VADKLPRGDGNAWPVVDARDRESPVTTGGVASIPAVIKLLAPVRGSER